MSIEKSNLFGTQDFEKEFGELVENSKPTYVQELEDGKKSITEALQEVIIVVQKYCAMSDSLIKVSTVNKVPVKISFTRLNLHLIKLSFEAQLLADAKAEGAIRTLPKDAKDELLLHSFYVLKEFHTQMRETNSGSVKYLKPVIKEVSSVISELEEFNDTIDFKNKIRGNYYKSMPN